MYNFVLATAATTFAEDKCGHIRVAELRIKCLWQMWQPCSACNERGAYLAHNYLVRGVI